MKTIRIILRRDGKEAVCTNAYHFTDGPLISEWTGNVEAFSLQNGSRRAFLCGIDSLPETCADLCARSGATFTIEDLGGHAFTWVDHARRSASCF